MTEQIKPSVAVLPFENLSRDPEQDYFSEGIAEDLDHRPVKDLGSQVAGSQREISRFVKFDLSK